MKKTINKIPRYSHFFHTSTGVKLAYVVNFESFNPKIPLIVFNYGLVCNKQHWDEQYHFFHKKGYQLLLHDYRCHYTSTCGKKIETLTFENMANDIYQLVNHIGAKKIIMIGHSMGVNVTLEYARRHPRNIKAMVLISGTVQSPQDVMFDTGIVRLLFPIVETIRNKVPHIFDTIWKTSFLNPLIVHVIRDGGFNKEHIPTEMVVHYLKNISRLKPQIFFQLFKAMSYHDIGSHLKRIKKPVLILSGNNDKVIPPHLQQKLHLAISGSELSIIKNGSHAVQMDFPDIVNQKIHRFFEKHLPIFSNE